MREAYTKNPEKFREKAKVYAARHPEQLKATRKVTHAKWYSKPENRARKNTPHQKLRCKKYREANSDRYRAYGSARRARMYGAKGQPFTVEEIIERDGLICYLCSRELTRNEVTLDHVRPLSRGGAHAAFNIRIACRSCNCRKSTKLLSELDWYEGEDFTALDGIF
jgi:5-methylcytosine-specific restriction endonuclease McrA